MLVNSGNANAATGPEGIAAARAVQQELSALIDAPHDEVAVASTGVIGVPLPGSTIAEALPAVVAGLDGSLGDFSQAICTTDRFVKHREVVVNLDGGTVRLAAQAKGAGMISPDMATMLCFAQTDACVLPAVTRALLLNAAQQSFDRISVDGQMSTNDALFLLASGSSGVTVCAGSQDEMRLDAALRAVLRDLAIAVIKDGEGSRRVGRVVVHGPRASECEAVARTVANSPLVKTALHGGDPNWGRVAQAVGASVSGAKKRDFSIRIGGEEVCRMGAAVPHDRRAAIAHVEGDEIDYRVDLGGTHTAEVMFSDLGREFVRFNAEYAT